MTFSDIAKRAQDRWDADKRIPLPDVELIHESRFHEPPKGDRIADRWNINHGGMAGYAD